MNYNCTVQKSNNFLRYSETLRHEENNYKLVLDYDGFALEVQTEHYLDVLDDLHIMVADEFEKTVKSPVVDYMKSGELL
jgi:hypothetical protein